jgi:TonB family protein
MEVAPDVIPEAVEPSAPPRNPSAPFVPPPAHTHPYPVAMDHDAHPHDPSLVHLPFAPAATSPEAMVATPPTPARFSMTVTTTPAVAPAASAWRVDAAPESGSDSAPLSEDDVSSPARLATAMSPAYPSEARAQEIEADVVLAIVVASTGEVVDARVLKAAGFGFDQEALRAVRAARFIPARHEGRRVAVQMRWAVSFRLR